MKAYLFVHVPKTAGTSFRIAAEDVLGGERIAYDYALKQPLTHAMVRRHVYQRRDLEALRECLVAGDVAMLGGHFHYERYAALFAPEQVVTFLREPIARVVSEYEHFKRLNGFEGSLLEFAARPRNRSLQRSMLAGAPLEQVAFFGITERYAESLQLLQRRVGWKFPALVRNVNPSRSQVAAPYSLTRDEDAQLREWNAADLAFYADAVRLFDARVAAR